MKYRKVICEQTGFRDSPILTIFARGEDGQKYKLPVKGLPSYFFTETKPSYPPELQAKVKNIEEGYKSIYGTPLWKITTYAPGDTNVLRKGLQHYEADIHWTERACIDLKLTDGFRFDQGQVIPDNSVDHIPLRTWVLDIEVSSPPAIFADWNNPNWPIVCIVVYDSYDKRTYTFSTKEVSEQQMIRELIQFMNEIRFPDIITGWNIGYDISYILSRCSKIGIDPRELSPIKRFNPVREYSRIRGFKTIVAEIPGIVVFDGLQAYKVKKNPSGQLSSYNLHSVAEKELNGLEWDDLGNRIEESWKNNPDDVIKYCQTDVEAEWKIINKEKLIEQALTLCRLSGCTLPQTTKKEQIIDHTMLLRRGGRILPSKKSSILRDHGINPYKANEVTEEQQVKVKGAVVLKPRPGIHKYLGVFDAAALYPSIIAGFNISPETKDPSGSVHIHAEWDEEIITGKGRSRKVDIKHIVKDFRFKDPSEQLGIMPEAITEFRKLRERVREKKRLAEEEYGHDSPEFTALEEEDTADKFIITSFYGVNGFSGFRLFDPDCANAITAVGRDIISGLVSFLGERGFSVEYGDTDSVFVKMASVEDGPIVSGYIKDFLNKRLEEMGVKATSIDVKFEKFFNWCIFKQREIKKGVFEPVKKKYVAHMTFTEGTGGKLEPSDYMYIRGFETRRSDSPPILKDTMKEFFDIMRQGKFDEAIELVKKVKKNWKNYAPYDMAIPKKAILDASKLKVKTAWQTGVDNAQYFYKWQYDDQSAVALLYLRGSGGLGFNKICIQKHHTLPRGIEIDYDKMFEKVIRKKFEPLIQAMGKEWEGTIEPLPTSLEQWLT